jgi:pimeloyl-ACP methyl ester carboxylesterase
MNFINYYLHYIYNFQDQSAPPTTKSRVPYNVEITNLGFKSFLANFNYESDLINICCPTLIIFGKNDWINDPSLAVLMNDKIPNSKLILLDKCGHFIWRDQRDNFFIALKDFLLPSFLPDSNELSSEVPEESYSFKMQEYIVKISNINLLTECFI